MSNHLLETFEIEQGISANEDEANDDPGKHVVTLDLASILESTVKTEALLFVMYHIPKNMCSTEHMCTLILMGTNQLCLQYKMRTLLTESHSLNSEESSKCKYKVYIK